MAGVDSSHSALLGELARVDDPAQLERLVPLLDHEVRENNLESAALSEALAALFSRTTDPGLCGRIKRLQNRLRSRRFLGRDLLRPIPPGSGSGSDEKKENKKKAKNLWDELRELKKSWRQATGQPDFDDLYEVREKIGDGGMSRVYLALRKNDTTLVAIKFLRRRFFASSGVVERFQRECRVCLSLDHPHIIRVFAAGEHEGGGFLVMEYLPLGGGHRLLTDPGFGPAMALQVATQSAQALQVIHDRGIIHRDLKPANLLIADYQPEHGTIVVKLTDFGICRDKTPQQLTKTGDTMGTDLYVAPEQLQNAAGVDFRADLYSLGVLIYRLFSRKEYPVGCYTPLHELRPSLPPELDTLVAQCLRHNPDKRPASALEINQRLQKISLLLQKTGYRS